MVTHQHLCPLYQNGSEEIHFCTLDGIGCPTFGDNANCVAYKVIQRQYHALKAIQDREEALGNVSRLQLITERNPTRVLAGKA